MRVQARAWISITCAPVRIRDLRNMSPDWLNLLGIIPCHDRGSLEADLHRRFAHLRAHGEWFRPEAELMNYIRLNAKEVPDANDGINPARGCWEAAQADLWERKKAAFATLDF